MNQPPPVFAESFSYKSSVSVFVWLSIGLAVVGGAMASLSPQWFSLGVGLMAGAVTGVITAMALKQLFIVTVMTTGIRCYDGLGIYHNVPWDDMQSTYRLTIFPGLSYIGVRHRNGFAIIIPTFLIDFAGFRDNVIRLAPAANPLRQRLE